MPKKIRAWKRFKPHQIISALVTVIGIGAVGAILLTQSHASNIVVIGDYEGAGNVSGINSFASETKSTIGIAADYQNGSSWSTIESSYPSSTWTGTPYQLELGVNMLPNSGASLAQGATGAYNNYFTTLAQNLVSAGESNAILRIGWEWDQSSFPWYVANTSAATNLAAYWKQIVTAMRAVPGANFNYSWYYGDSGSSITTAAYPGSSYVSSIALDQYDQTWTGNCKLSYKLTAVPTPSSQMVSASTSNCVWNNTILPAINGLASFASKQNEPIGFGEWGVITRSDGHGLGDDPTYINNFSNWLKSHNVEYASYFDFDSGGNSVLSNYPQSLAAFRNDFNPTALAAPVPVVNPPSVPTNVSATSNNATSVTVTWKASTDTGGQGLGGYEILRNGVEVGTVNAGTTSYTDTSVSGNTSYSYAVEAYDTSEPQLFSDASTAVSIKTPTAVLPSTPTNVAAKATSFDSVTVTWRASTDTGGPGIDGYNVFRGGVKINSSPITYTTYTDTTVSGNTSYSYTVEAVDKSSASSNLSAAVMVTTLVSSDTTPPSIPGGVTAKANGSNSVTVSWKASTDSNGGGGVNSYFVLRSTNGSSYTTLTSVSGTSYTDTSVSSSTSYSYEIQAHDTAGNTSNSSAAVSIQTSASTATNIAAPIDVTATATSTSQINLSWVNGSTAAATSYSIYKVGDSTALATLSSSITSYGVTGLNQNTAYSFYVVAHINNVTSPNSATVSATTEKALPSSSYATGAITGIDGKCLDNFNAQKINNNKIELWSCLGDGAQKWTYNPSNGTITNNNGYCLDVYSNKTTSGTLVDLFQCDGTSAQTWSVKAAQGVAGPIVATRSGLCLDDQYSRTNNGNQIWVYSCNGTGAQKWTVN
ncbi:MAG: ricin-type beta-trefoil lectin domain protein [Candidatus Saccharibacteria bacterium]